MPGIRVHVRSSLSAIQRDRPLPIFQFLPPFIVLLGIVLGGLGYAATNQQLNTQAPHVTRDCLAEVKIFLCVLSRVSHDISLTVATQLWKPYNCTCTPQVPVQAGLR